MTVTPDDLEAGKPYTWDNGEVSGVPPDLSNLTNVLFPIL